MTNPTCYYDTDSMDLGGSDFSYVGSASSNDWTATVTMDQATNLVNGDHEYSLTVSAEGGASATAYGSMLIATPTGSTLEDLTGYPDCVGPTCTYHSDPSSLFALEESITVEFQGSDLDYLKSEPQGVTFCGNTLGFGELNLKTLRLYSCANQYIESNDIS